MFPLNCHFENCFYKSFPNEIQNPGLAAYDLVIIIKINLFTFIFYYAIIYFFLLNHMCMSNNLLECQIACAIRIITIFKINVLLN